MTISVDLNADMAVKAPGSWAMVPCWMLSPRPTSPVAFMQAIRMSWPRPCAWAERSVGIGAHPGFADLGLQTTHDVARHESGQHDPVSGSALHGARAGPEVRH